MSSIQVSNSPPISIVYCLSLASLRCVSQIFHSYDTMDSISGLNSLTPQIWHLPLIRLTLWGIFIRQFFTVEVILPDQPNQIFDDSKTMRNNAKQAYPKYQQFDEIMPYNVHIRVELSIINVQKIIQDRIDLVNYLITLGTNKTHTLQNQCLC